MSLVREALAAAGAALVPPRCAGCGAAGDWLCAVCRASAEPAARTSGLPVGAAGAYAGPLRDAVRRFKYEGERGLAQELGRLVGSLVARDLAAGARLDAAVPVPLHPGRARERGYDQALLLARVVAADTGLPLLPVLHRIRRSRPQVDLDRIHRADNVRAAFVSTAGALRGLRVALIDDVATTGATMRAAAAACRAAGARGVRAYAVAIDE